MATNDSADLPFTSLSSASPRSLDRNPGHESIVVSIPDVAVSGGTTTATRTIQKQFVPQPSNDATEPENKVHSAPPTPHNVPQPKPAYSGELAQVIPEVEKLGLAQYSATAPDDRSNSERVADDSNDVTWDPVPKPTVTQSEASPTLFKDDAVEAARATQTKKIEDSIVKIADEILARFPAASSSVVMLAGSQATLHTDETCARVAAELASRNLGRVLLVDSEFEGRRLTKASGMSSQGGLSEIMNIAFPWRDAILKSGSSKLDFMAAGNCPHKRWTPKAQLRNAIAEIRNEYQFVCVTVGDAHNSAAGTWAEIADGAFLVLSATHSSDAVAQSAVKQLRDAGARMVGCVVADATGSS